MPRRHAWRMQDRGSVRRDERLIEPHLLTVHRHVSSRMLARSMSPQFEDSQRLHPCPCRSAGGRRFPSTCSKPRNVSCSAIVSALNLSSPSAYLDAIPSAVSARSGLPSFSAFKTVRSKRLSLRPLSRYRLNWSGSPESSSWRARATYSPWAVVSPIRPPSLRPVTQLTRQPHSVRSWSDCYRG